MSDGGARGGFVFGTPHPERGRLVAVGRWSAGAETDPRSGADPWAASPYFVAIHWFADREPLRQPVTEERFFNLLNRILDEQVVILDVEVA